jgi:hypothetical protein
VPDNPPKDELPDFTNDQYAAILNNLLMRWRIEEIANDIVGGIAETGDAIAEIEAYRQMVEDGTAVLNMTKEQRLRVYEWSGDIAVQNVMNGKSCVGNAAFESWFSNWEKQTFGI